MRQRSRAGKPASITFTYDFHELVTGDLRPGGPVLLRYDPRRIVPDTEFYRFGDPDRPIAAHVQYRQNETPTTVTSHSPAGVIPCPDVDLTGQGSMLIAQLQVPADAERLILWFSYASASGEMRYDSDYGENYRFGFPCREIGVVQATVIRRPDQAADRFEVVVSAVPAVEQVIIEFSLVADPACAEHELRLQRTNDNSGLPHKVFWAAGTDVPEAAIVRFKVYYWISGQRLVDDNTGAYYLAPEPPPDRVPAPPHALLEAAAAWR